MTDKTPSLPETRSLPFEGPAGVLDARLDLSRDESPLAFLAVFGHPHPRQGGGGTMFNNVVVHGSRELVRLGGACLRFNFRGVGDSAGAYDEGRGETEDYRAAVHALRTLAPELPGFREGLPMLGAGFSFGSIRALECAAEHEVDAYLGVAPPVSLERYADLPSVPVPAAILRAGADELVPVPTPEFERHLFPQLRHVEVVEGAGHLFTRMLSELRSGLGPCVRAILPALQAD